MTSHPGGPGSRSTRGPDTEPIRTAGVGERQRAAIALGVLAIVALVVVGIMVAVLGSSGDNPTPTALGNPSGPAVTVTGGAPKPPSAPRSARPGRTAAPKHKRARRPAKPSVRPRSHPVSCPTGNPCALPDDVGDVVGALNAFRAAHGKPAVQGAVTPAARRCALSGGDNCPNGYFWEPVGRSGHEVIQKIAEKSDGVSWLLAPRMTRVQVGWAYLPSSHSFECAVISNAG